MDTTNPVCKNCGAIGSMCCATARARLEIATSLERLVRMQVAFIRQLTLERNEARIVVAELRAKLKKGVV